MDDIIRQNIVVTGRVQGVGYRYFVQREAHALGLAGFVRNLASGDVEAEVEGVPDLLTKLLVALRRGPALARVDVVKVTDCPVRNDTDERFTITY